MKKEKFFAFHPNGTIEISDEWTQEELSDALKESGKQIKGWMKILGLEK